MRYHTFKSQHKKEDFHYKIVKSVSFFKAHMRLSSRKRRQSIENYHMLYDHELSFRDDNGLNDDQYYIPEAIVVLDVISKEKLLDVKKGLKLLFRKHYSHKFLGGFKTERDIEELIDSLDLAISEGKSWHRIGKFDMENVKTLKNEIDYFDVVIRNFSTSYLEIEFYIFFSEEKQKELNQFTRENYNAKTKSATAAYSSNTKKSGARINYGIGTYNDIQEKRELLYDSIELCKYKFLRFMKKYFPLHLFGCGHLPIGIIVNKTNIHYSQKCDDFWASVGIIFELGTFINESIKLFPYYELSHYNHNMQTDYLLVYNEETLNSDYLEMFQGNKSRYVIEWLSENLSNMYKAIIISNIAEYYNKKCAYFRNKINRIKVRKRTYARLLKLRYKFHINFALMEQIKKEINLENLRKQTEKYFQDNFIIKSDKYSTYKNISTLPIKRFQIYIRNKNILEERLNEKIILAEELKQYYDGRKDWSINLITFAIGVGTFLFLIFPSWAEVFADYLIKGFEIIVKWL